MHQSRHMWRTFKCFDVTLMKRNDNCHCFDYIYRSIGKAEIKCYSASDAKGQNAFISLLKFYFIFSYRIKFCLLILVFLQHLASNEILFQPLEITIGRNCQCVPLSNFSKEYKNNEIECLENRFSISQQEAPGQDEVHG